jgi:archaellum component FlaC
MESIEKLDTRYKAIKEEYGKLKNDKNLTEDEKIILDK